MEPSAPASTQSFPSGPHDDPGVADDLHRNCWLLLIACLFTMVGGYLDAYSYLAHGNVFANAQTGNVILLAVKASDGRWAQAARHLPPIAAFALGVAAAHLIGIRTEKREYRATLFCQGIEIVILAGLAGSASRLPDAWVVPVISFVAALQNISFSKIGPWSFTSPMTTGNLREAVSGLTRWLLKRDAEKNRAKAIALGWVCLSFLAGALAGSVCTRWNAALALWPSVDLVAVGMWLTYQGCHRRPRASLRRVLHVAPARRGRRH